MKFGKSYYTATTSLPEEWRQRAIDYKQLKKLINRVVLELEHLGLNPAVLQRLLTDAPIGASNRETILDQTSTSSRAEDTQIVTTEEVEFDFPWGSGVIYEIDQSQPGISDSPVVHLRLPVVRSRPPAHLPEAPNPGDLNPDVDDPSNAFVSQTTQTASESSLPRRSFSSHTSLSHISTFGHNISTIQKHKDETSSIRLFESVQNDITSQEDVVIPLTSDSAFLHLLSSALVALSTLYQSILVHCETQVQELTTLISSSARPRSQGRKSDLDTWRTIFQLWVDTEIFESLAESSKGELPVHESDERLRRFMDGIVRRGYTDRRHMRISSSREALDRFCALNVLLLDLKKFQQANLEATRKILKKHQKRTSLPSSVVLPSLSLTTRRSETLPHAILLTMTQTLLPIIPSIDASLSNLYDWRADTYFVYGSSK
ncbi:hypothetical protein FRB96_000860 [Tulasnella sp. 330]|nr:hypothetical protein FRB96_000860 [Tulasnella sp. 330]